MDKVGRPDIDAHFRAESPISSEISYVPFSPFERISGLVLCRQIAPVVNARVLIYWSAATILWFMSRPLRLEYEQAVYHVTARGNERRAMAWLCQRQRRGAGGGTFGNRGAVGPGAGAATRRVAAEGNVMHRRLTPSPDVGVRFAAYGFGQSPRPAFVMEHDNDKGAE